MGLTTEARGLLAEKWVISDSFDARPFANTSMVYNISVYFAYDETPGTAAACYHIQWIHLWFLEHTSIGFQFLHWSVCVVYANESR
jgi:hypothetical protein